MAMLIVYWRVELLKESKPTTRLYTFEMEVISETIKMNTGGDR